MDLIERWGFANLSAVYGPDELSASTAPGIRYLFAQLKRRWPQATRLAVLNWPAQELLSVVDVLVFQYQLLSSPAMAAARDAYVNAGKQVWGYHCISPTPSTFLNSFVDVPLLESRLIPWYAARTNLTGWLYWFINWGWRHAPSAIDNRTGNLVPLSPLEQSTGYSDYDPAVTNGNSYTNRYS